MEKDRDPRLDSDPDYIRSPRFGDSLKNLLSKNPHGVSDNVIAKVLDISVTEVKEIYENIVKKLKTVLKEN